MNQWLEQRASRMKQEDQVRQMAITESTTDLVAMLDIDGFIIHLNKAGFSLLEFADNEDITQLRMVDVLDQNSGRNFISNDINRAIASGASHSELTVVTTTGTKIPCSIVLIAHKDSYDNLSHFSVILRDIRLIKEAEYERQQLLEQLHRSRQMETLGRLAGGVAHDYNNLMTIIMGNAELGLMNLKENKSSRAELEVILDSAGKAARLSSQLLDFSSKQMIEPQVMNLNEVIKSTQKLVNSMMGEGITITLDCATDLWPIKIDRSQLEQIILNLSVNAHDAMESKGDFILQTSNVVLTTTQAASEGLEKGGGYVELLVRDTGCGMDENIQDKIFDPFFTTKEKGKGTGLGLSAVYGSVKQNMGNIHVDSEPGVGTTFRIRFPKSEAENLKDLTETTQTDDADINNGTETIILVEDDKAVRELLARVLSKHGYTILEAEDGIEALNLIENGAVCDLVISDIIMPRMDGMELFRELKRRKLESKIILMSGHSNEFMSLDKLSDENITLLKKPFQPIKFSKIVRDLLDGKPTSNVDLLKND